MSASAVLSPGVCAGHRHREHDAPGLRGARHGAAGIHPGAGEQRADVAARSTQAAARIVAMVAEDLQPRDILTLGGVRERGHRDPLGQRVDQLGQAPAGGRGRGGGRRGRLPAVRDPGRRGAAAHRDQAQRRDVDRGVRGRGRHPGDHEAARAAARRERADRHRRHGRRRTSTGSPWPTSETIRPPERALGRAADDRGDPRQPLPGRRDRQAGASPTTGRSTSRGPAIVFDSPDALTRRGHGRPDRAPGRSWCCAA